MTSAGIVCEYNPFHLGHQFHMEETRKKTDCDVIICAMSGDFAQRGEAALLSKYSRAKAAILCGADLVVEIFPQYSLLSAEGYARAGVGMLYDLGVDYISFGSELGEIDELKNISNTLLSEEFNQFIKVYINANPNISFAAARQSVLEKFTGQRSAALLSSPNNILAIEYLKAVDYYKCNITPITVKRNGADHDTVSDNGIKSASEIRKIITSGEDFGEYLPENAAVIFQDELSKGNIIDYTLFNHTLLTLLRTQLKDSFFFADVPPDLSESLYNAVKTQNNIENIMFAAKSKRYALSSIRRLLLRTALGIKAAENPSPNGIRVLAASKEGCKYLKEIGKTCQKPIITKPASAKKFSTECFNEFELTAHLHDIYTLGFHSNPAPGEDWRTSPFIYL